MSKVLVSESNLQDIADAIREKNGSSDTYTPGEMSTAIENIPSGGGDVSEYFNDTISTNTSNSDTVITQSVKKLPTITINGNVTSLQGAFFKYRGENIPTLNILSTNINDTSYMFQSCSSISSIPLFDTSKVTNMNSMFSGTANLETIPLFDTSKVTNMSSMFANSGIMIIPQIDTSNVTNMSSMFNTMKRATTIPQIDTSNVTNMSNMFYNYSMGSIETISLLNASKVSTVYNIFGSSSNNSTQHTSYQNSLTTLGGFKDLGQAYSTTISANNNNYSLSLMYCYNLTHDSLMNVINNLYDIATKGCNAQKLILGTYNMAKLTAEEIAIATNKGWTVS